VAGKDPDWVKVYVHGEYGYVRDGKPVYPEFKDPVHAAEFEVTDKLPLYIGIDFGLTPAATIAQRSPMGQWRVHSELVSEDMGAVRFSEVLRRVMNERYKGFTFAKITGGPAGDVRAQTEEVTQFQILRKAGTPVWLDPLEFSFVEGFREHECKQILRMTDAHLDEFLRAWYVAFGGLQP
jgi:hypothetical protein